MNKEELKIQMPKLHSGQLKMADYILKSKHFYYILNCSRQSGKSFLLEWLLVYYSLKYQKKKNYFLSPYYSQAKKSFRNILNAFKNINYIQSQSLTELFIILKNGTEIHFKGTDNYDSIRGISPNYLFMDEFAFIKEDAWRNVIKAALQTSGEKCFIASTPRAKQTDYHKMYMDGLKGERYKSFHMTYKDNPMCNMEEIEDAKHILPDVIFNCEYMAEFMDSGGEVFSNIDENATLKFSPPNLTERYYAGIDLGRVNDYTVLTILNSKKEVVFIYRENQKDWNTIIFNLVQHIKRYNVKKCYVELNNVGDVIYDMLRKELGVVIDGSWTGVNKADMIESLIVELEQSTIKIPMQEEFNELYNELTLYTYEYNIKSRRLTYNAPEGKHDDCVMSLAIALDCFKKYAKTSRIKTYSF